ncbi:MAG: FtsQ-type POTRA domain-containing protein [Candidatus Yonathbacteria bacterium]|nr:FtsQ-type POTRA domain-containing protein [Candidatus Yonathbacteria bacterium]
MFLWKIAAIFFMVVIVVMGTVWGLSRPSLRIARIEINGNSVLGTDEITSFVRKEMNGKYFFLFPKDSIVFYPKERIQNRLLDSFKWILSLSVTAKGLTTLSIAINERKPYSLWCGESLSDTGAPLNTPCYFMDEAGFLFAQAPHFSDNVYVEFYGPLYKTETGTSTSSIIPAGSIFLPISEFKIIELFRDLLRRIGLNISKVITMNTDDVTFVIREGGKILVNKKQDPMKLVSDIESAFRTELGDPGDPMIRKQVEYIDARFTNKIFFKKKK